jgi:dihydroorotase
MLLVHGGHVVSPDDGLDADLDILIEDGIVREIAPHISAQQAETLEALGQVVCPGLVDLHVHLREPGGEISETLESGLAAAVAGGFTAVCPMPNTQPVNDNAQATRALIEKAQRIGLARVFPIGAVSLGSRGETLTDHRGLRDAGAVAFSDDGRPVKSAGLMRLALEATHGLDVPIIDHCEDPSLSAGGAINQGLTAERLGLKGIPNSAEDVCVARDLVLAEALDARLHIAHLSTAGAVAMVRSAKRRGVRVTCEVTPHHFTLTDEAVIRYGPHAKMNPPLRSARDVEAVVEGLADGTIDAIATDHAPHAPELKRRPLAEAPFGVIGLETALSLALTKLVHTGRISLRRLVSLLSSNPASIIRPAARGTLGSLQVGAAADITVFDVDREWAYDAALGRSKSRNSPFDGWPLRGAVTATIVSGETVYRRA